MCNSPLFPAQAVYSGAPGLGALISGDGIWFNRRRHRANVQIPVVESAALNQTKGDGAIIAILHHGAEPADAPAPERDVGAAIGTLWSRPVEVKHHQQTGRPAEVFYARYCLLSAVATFF